MCTPTLARDIDRLREQWSVSIDEFTNASLAMDLLLDGPHDQVEFERQRSAWLAAAYHYGACDLTLWAACDSLRHFN